MPPKKLYGDAYNYECKLKKVMDRLGVKEFNFNWSRFDCYIEFRYKGEYYRFDHSVEKAKLKGVQLTYGSDAFAQVVLALEDLARMVERGIYDLQTYISGLKCLPAPAPVPHCFTYMGFNQIPSKEQFEARRRVLLKGLHPDAGGSQEGFEGLMKIIEQAGGQL